MTKHTPNKLEQQLHIEGENWKPIPGYEGLYEASDFGRIKGVKRDHILKQANDGRYCFINLSKNGITWVVRVHYLITLTFFGERPKGYDVNHKDKDKTNNHLSNLEYITRKDNIHHAARNGKLRNNTIDKQSAAKILKLAKDRTLTYRDISTMTGISYNIVVNVATGKRFSNPAPYEKALDGKRKRLSPDDVVNIRKLLADKDITQREIARRYGVHETVISNIKYGREYKEVS